MRYDPTADVLEIEADQRHTNLIGNDLQLDDAKAVDSPRVKHPEETIWQGYDTPALDATNYEHDDVPQLRHESILLVAGPE